MYNIFNFLEKKNNRIDILIRRNNYVKTYEIFNNSIFKANKNKLLLANKYKLDIINHIIKNN